MYSGITVKTHVKTVKLNYSGLLYHVHLFAIHSTMQKCKWYNNPLYVFQVYSYFTALGAAIQFKKYSGITVILITVVYCTLHTCFHVSHICSAECRDAQDHLVQFSIPFFDVIFLWIYPRSNIAAK